MNVLSPLCARPKLSQLCRGLAYSGNCTYGNNLHHHWLFFFLSFSFLHGDGGDRLIDWLITGKIRFKSFRLLISCPGSFFFLFLIAHYLPTPCPPYNFHPPWMDSVTHRVIIAHTISVHTSPNPPLLLLLLPLPIRWATHCTLLHWLHDTIDYRTLPTYLTIRLFFIFLF